MALTRVPEAQMHPTMCSSGDTGRLTDSCSGFAEHRIQHQYGLDMESTSRGPERYPVYQRMLSAHCQVLDVRDNNMILDPL